MTQAAIQITETPPLPGLKLVPDLNKALQTLATDFAGSSDPAALAGPYMTWADTGNMLLKRRNAANTDWVVEGALLDFFYSRTSVVGTVGQSGGIPTGSVVQRIENANGMAIRWADGTQVCISPAAGYAHGQTWGFPAAFAAVPTVSLGMAATNPRIATHGAPSTSSVTVYVWDINGSSSTGSAPVTAYGRWFL